jgi:hypothetical protein
MLKKILESLKKGENLHLDWCVNQYGEKQVTESLSFKDGVWLLWEVTCFSSSEYGFGCCRCNSHQSSEENPISRESALTKINDYIKACQNEERTRQKEIEWLDNAIKELSQ